MPDNAVAERKRMEEALRVAAQARSTFVAGMAHELKTPLNAIIGFSELMLDEVPGKISNEQRQCLRDILTSARHLNNLINDVLDLSKVEAGRVELKMERLNLAELINDVIQTVGQMMEEKRHRLKLDIKKGLPQVYADESRLKQILLNLLSNAVKFTPPGGQLGIEATRQGDYCLVSVIDNGIGIKKEDQGRIFQAFTRIESVPGSMKGTGLGLTLTKQFVELMGGKVWVESEPRKGSRFTFSLRLAEKE